MHLSGPLVLRKVPTADHFPWLSCFGSISAGLSRTHGSYFSLALKKSGDTTLSKALSIAVARAGVLTWTSHSSRSSSAPGRTACTRWSGGSCATAPHLPRRRKLGLRRYPAASRHMPMRGRQMTACTIWRLWAPGAASLHQSVAQVCLQSYLRLTLLACITRATP